MTRFYRNCMAAGAALLAGGFVWAASAAAQQEQQPQGMADTAAAGTSDAGAEKQLDPGEARKRSKFAYQLDKRPDPFVSFIKKEEKKPTEDDPIVDGETNEPLTGMRLFEPGQLRLVAVMGVQGSKIAMAEDMAGKGYVLRENMLIGKHGQIVRIDDSGQVFIKETLKTKAGREITNDIVMSLKKEEDKK